MERSSTKILVDGGDPEETLRIKRLLGFIDGQTTNPSLIANNPHIKDLISRGNKLSKRQEMDEYRKIIEAISPLVGDAGVSIEVFADRTTSAQEMLKQGREMFAWVPNAYIKFPCTQEGLRAARMSVKEDLRVNMTLCFSQQQGAAVYAATKGSKAPVYVSPFIGRLDDIGQNGIDLIKNLKRMLSQGDGHLLVLAASIRTVEHLQSCISLRADLATIPGKVIELWAEKGCPFPAQDFDIPLIGRPIPYEEIDLEKSWRTFDIDHELTSKGIDKFATDYRKTVSLD